MSQKHYQSSLDDLAALLAQEPLAYQAGFLRGWLARLASEDSLIRREIAQRLELKQNQKGRRAGGS
jgi:hypothetical protein